MPAGSKILPLRSNVPAISQYCFSGIDPEFPKRALSLGESFIVGGENYGQGSSREHAALAPLYLGVKAVIAKSFARIHRSNLINMGIIPFTFKNPADYDEIDENDTLKITGILSGLESGEVIAVSEKNGKEIALTVTLGERERRLLTKGGLLRYIKEKNA